METNRVFYKREEVEAYFENQLKRVETTEKIVSDIGVSKEYSSINDAIEERFLG